MLCEYFRFLFLPDDIPDIVSEVMFSTDRNCHWRERYDRQNNLPPEPEHVAVYWQDPDVG
jgi:hypothetical protein